MAIFHLSVKTISRSAGRSATAAAAYRASEKIVDERTGEIHDYTRKGGSESADLITPKNAPKWAQERSKLWNAAEVAETRKNSTVAREIVIALPDELTAEERRRLALDFAKEIVQHHGCAADVAIHAPNREGDDRNHHAHILLSTRKLEADGFTSKTRELDDQKTGSAYVHKWRERFAEMQNERLKEAGIEARVDHRSLEAQGIERAPTQHLGVAAIGIERRTGQASDLRNRFAQEANDLEEIKQEISTVDFQIRAFEQEVERSKKIAIEQHKEAEAAQAAQAIEQPKPLSREDQFKAINYGVLMTMLEYEKKGIFLGVQDIEKIEKSIREGYAENPEICRQAIEFGDSHNWERAPAPSQASIERQQWAQLVEAEKAAAYKSLKEDFLAQGNAQAAVYQAHLKAKPLLRGKAAWEEKSFALSIEHEKYKSKYASMCAPQYPASPEGRKAIAQAALERAVSKHPEIASKQPSLQKQIEREQGHARIYEYRKGLLHLEKPKEAEREQVKKQEQER